MKFFLLFILGVITFSGAIFTSCKKSSSDNPPPSVTITSPINGENVDVFNIPIRVTATDDVNLSNLTIIVEGVTISSSAVEEITDINQKSYIYTGSKTFPLNLTSPETFKLTATATDVSGKTTTKSVTFKAN